MWKKCGGADIFRKHEKIYDEREGEWKKYTLFLLYLYLLDIQCLHQKFFDYLYFCR